MEKKEENAPNEIPWKNAPTVTVWRPKKGRQEIKKSWRFQEKKQVVGELETEIITKEAQSKSIVSQRLAQRSRVATAMINPYLRETNYLDDLKTEDNFLRPKISSFEKTKKE
jgi:predicted urease superfamily metal-dependent hydrolase